MKLNLVPRAAARSVASRNAFFLMLALVVVSLALALVYNAKLQGDLASWKRDAEAVKSSADEVVRASKEADEIVAKAKIVLTNTALVNAIDNANKAYPDLYDGLKEYIPSFFRVRSIEARSTGANGAMVTIQGYLRTFQQYSDVMIAILRYPQAVAIGRSGFGPIPEGDAGPFGYDPETSARGPIPGWSAVTITVQVTNDLRAPDARATLQAASSGTPPAGQPGAPTTAPTAPGAAPGTGGQRAGPGTRTLPTGPGG